MNLIEAMDSLSEESVLRLVESNPHLIFDAESGLSKCERLPYSKRSGFKARVIYYDYDTTHMPLLHKCICIVLQHNPQFIKRLKQIGNGALPKFYMRKYAKIVLKQPTFNIRYIHGEILTEKLCAIAYDGCKINFNCIPVRYYTQELVVRAYNDGIISFNSIPSNFHTIEMANDEFRHHPDSIEYIKPTLQTDSMVHVLCDLKSPCLVYVSKRLQTQKVVHAMIKYGEVYNVDRISKKLITKRVISLILSRFNNDINNFGVYGENRLLSLLGSLQRKDLLYLFDHDLCVRAIDMATILITVLTQFDLTTSDIALHAARKPDFQMAHLPHKLKNDETFMAWVRLHA